MARIYSFSQSGSYTTAYEARNSVAKALIDNLAAATISGWTVGTITSPAVSTSAAQTFSVEFALSSGYKLRFVLLTSNSSDISMSVAAYTTAGTLIYTMANPYVVRYVTSGYTGSCVLTIDSVAVSNAYQIYYFGGTTTVAEGYGEIYFEDKITGMPNFLLISSQIVSSVYGIDAVVYATNSLSGSPDKPDSVYYALPLYASIGNSYRGAFKDTLICGGYASSATFSLVNVDGVAHYRLGSGKIFVKQ